MKLIKKIRHQLHDRMIEKRLTNVNRHSIPFDKVNKVGILFNGTELKERDEVQKFQKELEKSGKQVKLLAFIDSKEEQSNLVIDHFIRKDLNWVGKNAAEAVKNFINQPFDLLIGCSDEQVLNDVAAQSKSKLRAGPITDKGYCYDLMIARNDKYTTLNYLQEVTRFLTKLKQSTNG